MFQIALLILLAAGQVHAQKSPRKLIPSLEGKDLFEAYCSSCHGKDAKGKGPVAAALKGGVPDLTTLKKRRGGNFPGPELEKMILGEDGRAAYGSSEMPVWGPVFRRVEQDRDMGLVRVRRLVEYIQRLQAK